MGGAAEKDRIKFITPLVSILIPAYNAEKWLEEAIGSALAQTWQRRELIIVDDGSQDETLKIARRFASKHVKVVTQANRGPSEARNRALEIAQGDYIQWLDADDLLGENKIECQLDAVDFEVEENVLLSSAWASFRKDRREAKFQRTSHWQDLSPAEWLRLKMEKNIWMAIENWLISRKLCEKAGPWNIRLRRDNDGEYISRVMMNSCRIRFIERARSYVRIGNPTSVSSDENLTSEKLESLCASMESHIRCLLALDNCSRSKAACVTMLRGGLIWFYPDKPELVERSRRLAAELGERIDVPILPWKYRIIRLIVGWRITKWLMFRTAKLKWYGTRSSRWLSSLWQKTSEGSL